MKIRIRIMNEMKSRSTSKSRMSFVPLSYAYSYS